MKSFGMRMAGLLCCGAAWIAGAQSAQKPAYLNPSLPAEHSGRPDLVHRMTLEEKATPTGEPGARDSTVGRSGVRLVERVSARRGRGRDNGVSRAGGIGGDVWTRRRSTQWLLQSARRAHQAWRRMCAPDTATFLRDWISGRQNINIFRDPRWGRGQETYGEDPFSDGANGRELCDGHAGRRSEILSHDFHAEAFCCAQRSGADAPRADVK